MGTAGLVTELCHTGPEKLKNSLTDRELDECAQLAVLHDMTLSRVSDPLPFVLRIRSVWVAVAFRVAYQERVGGRRAVVGVSAPLPHLLHSMCPCPRHGLNVSATRTLAALNVSVSASDRTWQ